MAQPAQVPQWQCNDCGALIDGADVDPSSLNDDDVDDVFSKGRRRGANLCPRCGGSLRHSGRRPA